MAATETNSINAATTGIVGNTGTSFTGTAATQYNVLVGGSTTSTLSNIAPSSTSGVPLISQGSSSNPTFGTAVVAGGGTGNTSTTAYALICGGTTTTGAFQAVADVATGSVLISGGTAALPSFSSHPQVSGLGIGASPGSTAGLTFDGSNFMASYVTGGTFTPAVTFGGASTGITYTTQSGFYTKIGTVVTFNIVIVLSSKGSATGTANITSFPYGGIANAAQIFAISASSLTFVGQLNARMANTDTQLFLDQWATTGSRTSLDNTAFANATIIEISGSYLTGS